MRVWSCAVIDGSKKSFDYNVTIVSRARQKLLSVFMGDGDCLSYR